MRVILHDEAVAEAAEDDLDELLLMVLRGRHHAVHPDAAMPALDAYLARRGWVTRWDAALDLGARELRAQRRAYTVEVVPAGLADATRSLPRLSTSDAVQLLRQPLHILVENGRNDGELLRALATLDDRLEGWDRYLRDGVIDLENGGGLEEMQRRLGMHLRDRLQRLRRFALFDSDAVVPGHASPASDALRSWCAPNNKPPRVGHHRLARRAAENYLPPSALKAWTEQHSDELKRRGRAWERLTAPQRHHYAMRDGLAKDLGNPMAAALFGDLADGPRQVLQHGFGREVRDRFDAANPSWARWMREDGQEDEVRALFQKILERV